MAPVPPISGMGSFSGLNHLGLLPPRLGFPLLSRPFYPGMFPSTLLPTSIPLSQPLLQPSPYLPTALPALRTSGPPGLGSANGHSPSNVLSSANGVSPSNGLSSANGLSSFNPLTRFSSSLLRAPPPPHHKSNGAVSYPNQTSPSEPRQETVSNSAMDRILPPGTDLQTILQSRFSFISQSIIYGNA